MRIRTKFIIFLILIHAIFLFLVIQLLKINQQLFIAGEVLVLISIGVSVWIFSAINRPLTLISAGIESIKDKDFNTRLVKVGHREMDELIFVYNQMIDQLREERIKLSEKNFFLDKLIQASPSGILVLDQDGKIDTVNNAASQMLKKDLKELQGTELSALQGTLSEELARLEAGGSEIVGVSGLEIYKIHKSHFIDKGFPHYFFLIEELTEEIYKKEKNAYEKVIRMMSHEINNSIGAINSILNTCLYYKDQLQQEEQNDYENALKVAISRNTSLSGFMSNFAKVVRVPEPKKLKTNLQDLVGQIRILMEAQAREKEISWSWELKEPVFIFLDPDQMEQVLVNVLKNSVEAIEGQGKITVSVHSHPAELTVVDTGKGIPPEISTHLFSPFFSTKKNGQGIGLTLVREILLNHGFEFSLEEIREGSTRFKIVF